MILILSHADDPHAEVVMHHLQRRGAAHALLDLSRFPRDARLQCRYGAAGTAMALDDRDGSRIDFSAVRAVWWRRPQPYGFEDQTMNVGFAANECDEAMQGLWLALDARWLNPPLADGAAHRKTWQLKLASELGFDIPETLVTNSASAARTFLAEVDRAVYKPFAGTAEHWRETRMFGPAELESLALIRHAPVILQAFVPGIDYRVTVVGQQIFAAAIDARDGKYPVDFRMNKDVRISAATLPAEVEAGVHTLMARMELVYGAIDFRRDERDGRFRFLEINPAGQWLFVEQQTVQPIAAAIADELAALAATAIPARLDEPAAAH
jgi:glutathione synthase/RimK-type ligase-like ATP-grasp enzyme